MKSSSPQLPHNFEVNVLSQQNEGEKEKLVIEGEENTMRYVSDELSWKRVLPH